MREGFKLTVHSSPRSESVIYELSRQSLHENLSVTCKGTATQGSAHRKWAAMSVRQSEEGAGLTGGGAQPHLVPRPREPDGRLVGAASGRQTQTHPLRQGLEGPAATAMPACHVVSVGGGHVVEVQRTSGDGKSRARTRAAPNTISNLPILEPCDPPHDETASRIAELVLN